MRQHFLEWMMCLCIGFSAPACLAATIRVPADKPTIQDAIDAAVSGDTVLIADGVYTGDGNRDLIMDGKEIILRSENGPLACIIDCQGSEVSPHRGIYISHCNPTVTGLTIRNGYAKSGAGIFTYSCPCICNCIFINNSASDHGGAITASLLGSGPTIINCLMTKNSAPEGSCISAGAVFGGPSIINCSLINNTGISLHSCMMPPMTVFTMRNCIIWGNQPSTIPPHQSTYYHPITYSDVETGYPGAGNIDKDPLILSRDPAGATLSPFSPCIDAGTAEDAPETDLYGNPRPTGNGIDMGAYEFTWPTETRSFVGMPSHRFKSGDSAFCKICLWNTGDYDLADARLFVVLDLMGIPYCAPGFGHFDSITDLVNETGRTDIEILPDFTWPAGTGTLAGVTWYAFLTDAGITRILGDVDVFEFGWEE